jgi:anthranilate phosphoribosyltransferase
LPYARLSDLTIDSTSHAAEVMRCIVNGEKSPKRDIVLLNSAAALVVAGRCEDLTAGLEIASRRCDARIEWVNGHASARRFPLEEFR